jgi:hypothetical protein
LENGLAKKAPAKEADVKTAKPVETAPIGRKAE